MYTIDYNVALSKNVLIPVVLLFSLLIIGSVNADESDIDISSIRYTNDFVNGEAVTIVSSGKDGGTEYKYNLYDDDDDDCDTQSCLPENWYATDFDDSSWSSGAAPFGNDEINGYLKCQRLPSTSFISTSKSLTADPEAGHQFTKYSPR